MSEEINWTCYVVGQPVEDKAGYVAVDVYEAVRVERERAEWDEARPGVDIGEMMRSYPGPARWQALHGACDPLDERGPYAIDVHRTRTPWMLLSWTAHLMGKTWLAATDWDEIIERVGSAHQEP